MLYVFVFDPTVAGADYSLGRILADAYPDAVQLNEIWKLYTGAVAGGGSLLNLTPLTPVVPTTDAGLPAARRGLRHASPVAADTGDSACPLEREVHARVEAVHGRVQRRRPAA